MSFQPKITREIIITLLKQDAAHYKKVRAFEEEKGEKVEQLYLDTFPVVLEMIGLLPKRDTKEAREMRAFLTDQWEDVAVTGGDAEIESFFDWAVKEAGKLTRPFN